MTLVRFYDPSFSPESKLTYSVITARYKRSWIFVRHHKRKTWEIPGGHIEKDETPDETASRELKEETGALEFKIDCVATYSVLRDGKTGYGRLYFAEILHLGEIADTSEIAEVILLDNLPKSLTYPDIQPALFQKVLEYIQGRALLPPPFAS